MLPSPLVPACSQATEAAIDRTEDLVLQMKAKIANGAPAAAAGAAAAPPPLEPWETMIAEPSTLPV